jgi:hypothetical protein
MHENKRLEIKRKTSECMDKNDSVASSMCKKNGADTEQVAYDLVDSEDETRLKTCLPGQTHCSLLVVLKPTFSCFWLDSTESHLVMPYNREKCTFQCLFSITLKGNVETLNC